MKRDIFLLGVGFNNLTLEQSLEYIIGNLLKSKKKSYVVTPNPEILVIANSNRNYKNTLNHANLALPDGVGIVWAAKLLGHEPNPWNTDDALMMTAVKLKADGAIANPKEAACKYYSGRNCSTNPYVNNYGNEIMGKRLYITEQNACP